MKKQRRPWGSGSVERYRARLHGPNDSRPVLGTYDTEEEAHRMLDAFHVAAAREELPWNRGETVREYGQKFLDRREKAGYANIATDRSRWKHHVESAPFIDHPLTAVTRREVREWVLSLATKRTADRKGKRFMAFQSRKHARNLLSAMFFEAIEDELVVDNPVARVRVKDVGATEEGWTYLTLEEQQAIAACGEITKADRIRILFACYTGLRQGEQWNLELRDVHHDGALPHVLVRKGSEARATKAKRIRRVALIPAAVELVGRWLEMLPAYAETNPHSLVFPTPRGCRRERGKLYGFKQDLVAAGISRPVRWHDLRHTCGSSLVAGWWGREWRLEEVRDVLGHSSITQTERYAHLAPSVVSQAAAETLASNFGHHPRNPTPFECESSVNPAARP